MSNVFQSPIDVYNRALDACGASAVVAGDGSRNLDKCNEIYDKVRQAELDRNEWVFSTRKAALRPIDTTTMLLVPNAWNSASIYLTGDIVSYLNNIYIAIQNMVAGNIPPIDANGECQLSWDNYYGPMTVDTWVNPNSTATTTLPIPSAYRAGELVYVAPGDGNAFVYLSLIDQNTDDPLQPDVWSSTTQYTCNQIVLGSNNSLYMSNKSFNIGNDPTITTGLSAWASGTTYAVGNYVYYAIDQQIYQSLTSGNIGNNPSASPSNWFATGMWNNMWLTSLNPQPCSTSLNWHFVACCLQPLSIVFPIGAGPLSQRQTENLYMLPANFLKRAISEDRLGAKLPALGGPGSTPDDYVLQGIYFISASTDPLVFRFISDFQNVSLMNALFCEGVAARMGSELCETLTQKPDLKVACERAYMQKIREARTANAIAVGPVWHDDDDYVRVRMS